MATLTWFIPVLLYFSKENFNEGNNSSHKQFFSPRTLLPEHPHVRADFFVRTFVHTNRYPLSQAIRFFAIRSRRLMDLSLFAATYTIYSL